MLDEVDSRIRQAFQTVPDQIAPIQPGQKEHVAARRLPALGHDAVSRGPEPVSLARQRLVRRLCAERYPRRKAGHSPHVVEVVGMLEVPTGQAHVVPMEPDRSRLIPHHGFAQSLVAQRATPVSRRQPFTPLDHLSSVHLIVIGSPVDVPRGLVCTRSHLPRRIPSATRSQSARLRQEGHPDSAIPASALRGHSTVRFWRDFDHQGARSG